MCKKICKTCRWYEDFQGEGVCFNGSSEHFVDYIDPNVTCEGWEKKDEQE